MLISWLTGPLRRGARTEPRVGSNEVHDRIVRLVRNLEDTPFEGRTRAFQTGFPGSGILQTAGRRGAHLDDLLDEGLLLIASLASVAPNVALLAASHVSAFVTIALGDASSLTDRAVSRGLSASVAFDASTPQSVVKGLRRGDRLVLTGHRLVTPGLRSAERMLVNVALEEGSALAVVGLSEDPLLEVRRAAFAVDGASTEVGGLVLHGVSVDAGQYHAFVDRDVAALDALARSVRDLCVLALHRGVAARAISEVESARNGPAEPLLQRSGPAALGELLWILDGLEGLEQRVRRHLGGPSGEPMAALAVREAASATRDVLDRVRRMLGARGLEFGSTLTRLQREAEILGLYERERIAVCEELGMRWMERRGLCV